MSSQNQKRTTAILTVLAGGLALTPAASAQPTCAQLLQQCLASNPPKPFYISQCKAQYGFPNCMDLPNPIWFDPAFPFGLDDFVSNDGDDWSTFMWRNVGPGLLGVVVEAAPNGDLIDHIDFRLFNETFNSVEPFGTLLASVDADGVPFGQFQVEIDPAPYQGMDGVVVAEVYYVGNPSPAAMVGSYMTARFSEYDDFKYGVQGVISYGLAIPRRLDFAGDFWGFLAWADAWEAYLFPEFAPGSSGHTIDDDGLPYLDWSDIGMADVGLVVPPTPFGLPIDHVEFRFYNESNDSFTPFGTLLGTAEGGGLSEGTFFAAMDAGPLQGMDGALIGEVHLAAGGAGSFDVSEYDPKHPVLTNQEFPDEPTFSMYGVDDFSTMGQTWNVDAVRAFYTNKHGAWDESITQGRLQVYAKKWHKPYGNDIAPEHLVDITFIDRGTFWEAVADTSGIAELQGISGNYWIGLTPIADYATYGQEYQLTRPNDGDDEEGNSARAYFRNPGNGFGLGTEWLPSDALLGEVSDLAFTLDFHVAGTPDVMQVGLIYVTAKPKDCYPDFNFDGQLDLFDFLGFVNAFNAGDPGADCNADAFQDVFDFLCFINAFNAGC